MKKEITKGEILDWIQYGILHDSLESELKDGILAKCGVDENDEERYNLANEIMEETAKLYFKFGFEIRQII